MQPRRGLVLLREEAPINLKRGKMASATVNSVSSRPGDEQFQTSIGSCIEASAYLQPRRDQFTHEFECIVGSSRALFEVMDQVQMVARTDSTVLIEGETGTGKELV